MFFLVHVTESKQIGPELHFIGHQLKSKPKIAIRESGTSTGKIFTFNDDDCVLLYFCD